MIVAVVRRDASGASATDTFSHVTSTGFHAGTYWVKEAQPGLPDMTVRYPLDKIIKIVETS